MGMSLRCEETGRVDQRQWLQAYLHKHPNTCYVTTLPLGSAQSYSNLSALGWKIKGKERCQISYVKEHIQCRFSAQWGEKQNKAKNQTNSLGALESRLLLATPTPLLPQPSTPMGFRFIPLLKAGEQVKRVRLSLRFTTFLYSNFSALSHTDQPSAWTT